MRPGCTSSAASATSRRFARIDTDVLPELSEADLEQLGLSLGHRQKLLKAIATLQAATGAPAEASATQPNAVPEIEGERCQVTVMFADLTSYTELSRQTDAEEVHRLLEGFFDRVDGMAAARARLPRWAKPCRSAAAPD